MQVSHSYQLELLLDSIRQSSQNGYSNATGGGIQLVDLRGCHRPIDRSHPIRVVVLRSEAGV